MRGELRVAADQTSTGTCTYMYHTKLLLTLLELGNGVEKATSGSETKKI